MKNIAITFVQLRKHTTMLNYLHKGNYGNFGVVRVDSDEQPNQDDLHNFISQTSLYREEKQFSILQSQFIFNLIQALNVQKQTEFQNANFIEQIDFNLNFNVNCSNNNLVSNRIYHANTTGTHDDMINNIASIVNNAVSFSQSTANEIKNNHLQYIPSYSYDKRIHGVIEDLQMNPNDYIVSNVEIELSFNGSSTHVKQWLEIFNHQYMNNQLALFGTAICCFVKVYNNDGKVVKGLTFEHNQNAEQYEKMYRMREHFVSSCNRGSSRIFSQLLDLNTTQFTRNFPTTLARYFNKESVDVGGFQHLDVLQTINNLKIDIVFNRNYRLTTHSWIDTYQVKNVDVNAVTQYLDNLGYSNHALDAFREMVMQHNGDFLVTFRITLSNDDTLTVDMEHSVI